MFSKTFYASKTKYLFEMTSDYTINFHALSGVGRHGKKIGGLDRFGYKNPGTNLNNSVENPVAVLRSVLKILNAAIGKHKPPYFQFTAREKKRKALYHKLTPKIEKLTGYKYVAGSEFLFLKN